MSLLLLEVNSIASDSRKTPCAFRQRPGFSVLPHQTFPKETPSRFSPFPPRSFRLILWSLWPQGFNVTSFKFKRLTWKCSCSALVTLAFVHAALQAGVSVAQTPGQGSSLRALLPFPAPSSPLSLPSSSSGSDVCVIQPRVLRWPSSPRDGPRHLSRKSGELARGAPSWRCSAALTSLSLQQGRSGLTVVASQRGWKQVCLLASFVLFPDCFDFSRFFAFLCKLQSHFINS